VIANGETRAGHAHVFFGHDLFEELERVEHAHVVRVEREGAAQRGNRVRLAPSAHQVHSEARERHRVVRIEAHGFAHELDDLVVTVLPVGVLADDGVKSRVLGILVEHRALCRFEAGLVGADETSGRA
jgi:hypothetical protein